MVEIASIEEIIKELSLGRMVILFDSEDRENEGDLVIPAQFADWRAINFMAKHGRGLICLALTHQIADRLGLKPMVSENTSKRKTAFTYSIEAKEGIGTGISAHDRAKTVSVAINPKTSSNNLASPGHVFPIIAKPGGVLKRAGHTEASVDLVRLSGLYPAAVICEIMRDDGHMARLSDLDEFSKKFQLKTGLVTELIEYFHQKKPDQKRNFELSA